MKKHYEHYEDIKRERLGYITYLVRNGTISRKTARCLINRRNEVPPESMSVIKDLYEKVKYEELNAVCDEVVFREVGNHGKNPFWNQKKYNF